MDVAVSKAHAGKFHHYASGKLRKSDWIVVEGNYHPAAKLIYLQTMLEANSLQDRAAHEMRKSLQWR